MPRRFDVTAKGESWKELRFWKAINKAVRQTGKMRAPYTLHHNDGNGVKWNKGPVTRLTRVRLILSRRLPRIAFGDTISIRGDGANVVRVQKILVDPPEWKRVIAAAKSVIGTKYVFGGFNGPEDPGPDAFDCSGLTRWAWERVGVELPHNAEAQRQATTRISDTRNLLPGDLVFQWFPNSRGIPPGQASHVGLWLRPGVEIDTRNPYTAPVAIRRIDGQVVGYGRPKGGR